MAKNMTRKGLALGAAFALATTGLVAAPAQAAAGIELAAQGGKSVYGMITGETFTFTANGNVDFVSSNAGLLRVEVVNTTGGGSPSGFAINGTALTTSNDIKLADGTSKTAVALGATAADKAVFGLGYTAAQETANAANVEETSAMTSPFTFGFTATAAADTPQAYAVTVFADTNNNGVKDAGELASATQTVTFYNYADVTVNYVIDTPVENATKVGADVTISGIALDQLTAAEFGVYWTTGVDGVLPGDQTAKVDAVAFDTNKTKFESDLTLSDSNNPAVNKLLKNTAVKAQLVWKTSAVDTSNSGNTVVGSYATAAVVTASVADVTASAVKSENANLTNFKPDTAFQVKALVEDAANGTADADPVAGQLVTAKVEVRNVGDTAAETLSATKYIIVNGVTYTDATKLPGASGIAELQLTTDASGEVVLNLETKGLEGTGNDGATNSVKVTFTSELISDAGSTVTLEARDAAFTAFVANHDTTSANTVDGTGVQFVVEAYDQYGSRPADVYDARAVFVSSNQGATATKNSTSASSVVQPMVGGRAVFTVTDNGTGTGANLYALTVEERASGGGYVGSSDILAASETAGAGQGGNFTINVVANATPGALTVSSYTKQTTGANAGQFTPDTAGATALNLSALGTYNANAVLGTEPTVNASKTLAGTVTTASSATVAAAQLSGVPVTISGTGLMFRYTDSGSKKIYATDSITVPSGASGAWSVDIASNTAGKATVTVTAGGVTETVVLDDYADAAAGTGTSLVISAPDAVAPGSTLSITATLTDKYGNPVATDGVNLATGTVADSKPDFAYSYTGPGLMVGSAPTKYGTDGTAKLGYFLGSNDSGTITVVFRYDANGDYDFADTGDLTVSKTIVIGTAGNTGDVTTWTKKLDDTSLKMYAKNVIGAGKVQFLVNGKEIAWTRANDVDDVEGAALRTANGAYYLVRTVDDRYLVSGRNVLTIVVDGVTTTTRIFTMD